MKKSLIGLTVAVGLSLGVAGPSLAKSSVVYFDDFGEPKIAGINVNKTTGYFPGIAIVNVKGYVIDLNPIYEVGANLPPASSTGTEVVNGWICPRGQSAPCSPYQP